MAKTYSRFWPDWNKQAMRKHQHHPQSRLISIESIHKIDLLSLIAIKHICIFNQPARADLCAIQDTRIFIIFRPCLHFTEATKGLNTGELWQLGQKERDNAVNRPIYTKTLPYQVQIWALSMYTEYKAWLIDLLHCRNRWNERVLKDHLWSD